MWKAIVLAAMAVACSQVPAAGGGAYFAPAAADAGGDAAMAGVDAAGGDASAVHCPFCTDDGMCAWNGTACIATAETCKASANCKSGGSCSTFAFTWGTGCAAMTDSDCAQSDVCKQFQECKRVPGFLPDSPVGVPCVTDANARKKCAGAEPTDGKCP